MVLYINLVHNPEQIRHSFLIYGGHLGNFAFDKYKMFRKLDFMHEQRGAQGLQGVLNSTKNCSQLTVVEGAEYNDFTINKGTTSIDIDEKTNPTHIGYSKKKTTN